MLLEAKNNTIEEWIFKSTTSVFQKPCTYSSCWWQFNRNSISINIMNIFSILRADSNINIKKNNIIFKAYNLIRIYKIIWLLLGLLEINPHKYLHLNSISPSFFLFFSTFCLFFSFPFQSWSLVILKCFFEIVNISYTFMFPENVLEQHYLTIQKTKSLFWCITTIYNFTE